MSGLKKTSLGRMPRKAPAKRAVVSKTTLNKLRDEMRESARGIGSLYFHAQVVVDNFGSPSDWSLVTQYATETEFKNDGISQLSDPVYSLSSSDKERVIKQTGEFVKKLRGAGHAVLCYKVSEVFLDSNNWDSLKAL